MEKTDLATAYRKLKSPNIKTRNRAKKIIHDAKRNQKQIVALGGNIIAVPARRTSKTKKNNRRANQKLKQPNLSRDPQTGEYHLSHHVSADGYYNGKKVIN